MNLSTFADPIRKNIKKLMKERIISTTYAPLEAPFQVISYGTTLGMQIGTLIVTSTDDDSETYAIRTHSHPVVAYANKKDEHYRTKRFALPTMEGVVWDQVELRDVTTVCLADGQPMSWMQFRDYLFNDLRMHYYRFPVNIAADILLKDFGIGVQPPEPGDYTIQLEKYLCGDGEVVRSTHDSLLVMATPLSDTQSMESELMTQLTTYHAHLRFSRKPGGKFIRLNFSTFEPELEPIVASLNGQRELNEIEISDNEVL